MQILAAVISAALLVQQGLAAPEPQQGYGYGKPPSYGQPKRPACPADKCFSSIRQHPSAAKTASSVCSKYIKRTDKTITTTTTKTVTVGSTSKVDQTQPQVTATATQTVTPPAVTQSPTCATVTSITTVAGQFATVTNYRVRGSDPASPNDKRDAAVIVPDMLGKGCGSGRSYTSKLSSACSCLLATRRTKTSTKTSTVTVTNVATSTNTLPAGTTTVTATATADPSTVTDCQTITTISTTTTFANGAGRTCGAPIVAYTSASLTCSNVAPPGETNARFRIEGGSEGNVFDGCIASGPENITTPSGGTHLCDGTNNNANGSPGSTLTTQIDAAGRQEGFGFDGTYANQFQDFFINSISATTSTGNQFWGVLRNLVFTARGGCQEQSRNGDEGLWAFDAFAPNRRFLKLDPEVIVVSTDTASVTLTVRGANPNNGNLSPVAGATLGGGEVSDANGNLQLAVPQQPGCYLYKAEASNAIRSNAIYLSVVDDL
ncbi:hypothetical protein Slin15195_G053080 [Septoria linicola]|uniref:Uncharacterized protein n=1 Tax=Septoria linicola TaxID=215465 RepID=A0A9Q9EJ99_9PEZI|nr:hypothetical protein Slin15195_G053080 [Septoria linicola]